MEREPNGKHCYVCGAPLLGQQERFCRRECKAKYWAEEHRSATRVPGKEKTCPTCGAVVPEGRRRFCSTRCCKKYHSVRRKPVLDEPAYVGHNKYPGTMAQIVEMTRHNVNYGKLVAGGK